MDVQRSARTVTVAARSRSRFARLKLRYPARQRSRFVPFSGGYARAAEHPRYDAELSMELLRRTGELPGSKRDLVALLTEYRLALHAVASQVMNGQATQ